MSHMWEWRNARRSTKDAGSDRTGVDGDGKRRPNARSRRDRLLFCPAAQSSVIEPRFTRQRDLIACLLPD